MTKQSRKKTRQPVRQISTKRDFEGVKAVVEELAEKPERADDAELRLELLLKELDKFDEPEDDGEPDLSLDEEYPGPGRRWSDEQSASG